MGIVAVLWHEEVARAITSLLRAVAAHDEWSAAERLEPEAAALATLAETASRVG